MNSFVLFGGRKNPFNIFEERIVCQVSGLSFTLDDGRCYCFAAITCNRLAECTRNQTKNKATSQNWSYIFAYFHIINRKYHGRFVFAFAWFMFRMRVFVYAWVSVHEGKCNEHRNTDYRFEKCVPPRQTSTRATKKNQPDCHAQQCLQFQWDMHCDRWHPRRWGAHKTLTTQPLLLLLLGNSIWRIIGVSA